MGLLTPITAAISAVGAAVTQPLKDVLIRKEERKQAHQTLQSQARMAEQAGEITVEVERTKLDAVMQQGLGGTLKDDITTYAFVGIVPSFIVGGVLHGFGYPAFLQGVIIGVNALAALIPLGNIMTVVVTAAVGISLGNRLKLF